MPESDPFAPFGQCDRDGCDEPCPWDMACVLFDQRLAFCSPECASIALESTPDDELPSVVKLHDPQAAIDREKLGLSPDSIDIIRGVSGREEIADAISEMAELMVGPWRVKGGTP